MLSDESFSKTTTAMRNLMMVQMSLMAVAMESALKHVSSTFASALSEVFGGDADPEGVKQQIAQKIDGKLVAEIAETRKGFQPAPQEELDELRARYPEEEVAKLDAIQEKHNLPLPRLTQELSDEELAAYLALALADDEKVGDYLQDMMGWFESLQAKLGG
jgi:hypothetical protein